jgi:Flp pilus assembly pilin Flp
MVRYRNRARSRGAVTVEYTILVGTVALASMAALVGLGVALLHSFEFVRSFVLYPYP